MDRRTFIQAAAACLIAPRLPIEALSPKIYNLYLSPEALEDIKNWGSEIYNNYEGEWYITYMEC